MQSQEGKGAHRPIIIALDPPLFSDKNYCPIRLHWRRSQSIECSCISG